MSTSEDVYFSRWVGKPTRYSYSLPLTTKNLIAALREIPSLWVSRRAEDILCLSKYHYFVIEGNLKSVQVIAGNKKKVLELEDDNLGRALQAILDCDFFVSQKYSKYNNLLDPTGPQGDRNLYWD